MSGAGRIFAAGLLIGLAVALWPHRRGPVRRRARDPDRADQVASALESIAMCLTAGLTPGRSVAIAAERLPRGSPVAAVLTDVRRAISAGDPGGEVWQRHTREVPEVRVIAGAWTLTEASGTALQPAVAWSARQLREQRAAAERLDAATAGAKASMGLLAVMPLSGPIFGVIVGLSPKEMYGAFGPAFSCFLGLCFAASGLVVSRRLLGRALRPKALPPDPPHEDSTQDDVTEAALLLHLVLSSGAGVVESLESVATVCRGRVRADLARVAAAYRWGLDNTRAWSYAADAWEPVAHALALALDHGAAPSEGVRSAGIRLGESERARLESAAGRAQTFMVLPLGLLFLPAFVFTTVVPIALALAPSNLGV